MENIINFHKQLRWTQTNFAFHRNSQKYNVEYIPNKESTLVKLPMPKNERLMRGRIWKRTEYNYVEYFSFYANIIRERYRRVKYRIICF